MKKIVVILTVMLSGALLFSCQKDSGEGLELSRTEILDVDFSGAEESLQITTGAAWAITQMPSWISADPESGTGNATVTLTIAVNNSEKARSASLQVKAGSAVRTITITQLGVTGERQIIPDRGFRTWLSAQGYIVVIDDTSGEVVVTERGLAAQSIAPVNPSPTNPVNSIEGIEFFPSILELDIRSLNSIARVDVSTNTKLRAIYLTGNGAISQLDVTMLPDLQVLQVTGCRLEEIDVTQNPKLTYLNISSTRIIELDVTKNPELLHLYCTTCTREEQGVSLSNVDLSKCPKLVDFNCGWNPDITQIDVSANPALEVLQVYGCGITELNTDNNPELENLQLFFTPELATVDVSNNPELVWFYLDETKVTEIDLSHNPKLAEFRCCDTEISELDLSHNPELITLYAYGSKLTSIDVDHNPKLIQLDIHDTEIAELDLSNNMALMELNCFWTKITSLDLSGHTAMTKLGWTIENGVCEYLNISGCKNMQVLQILSNTNNAIPGDDTLYLGATPDGAIYANIKTIIADDTRLAGSMNVSGNPVLETLSMQRCELGTVTLRDNPNLHRLYMNGTSAAGVPTQIVQSGNAADFQVVTSPRP